LTLAQQAQAALSGSLTVSDVTLTGTGTRTSGSDSETGNFTLQALGGNQSNFQIDLASGTRGEVFNLSTENTPQGFWTAGNGSWNSIASHNCSAGEVWFFPALSVLSQLANPNLSVAYVDQETKNGLPVWHLRFSLIDSNFTSNSTATVTQKWAQLSSTDVYLDSSTFLPVALSFDTHPDNDLLVDIPVEVDFSNYQQVQGIQVPFHVQKFLNRSLFLDLTVQSAIVNSGLTSSTFAVN
jgi:hypothetical protein